jgi:hypothetical protein
MESTRSMNSSSGQMISQAVLPSNRDVQRAAQSALGTRPEAAGTPVPKSGYGLPCAKCRKYYAADLAACPICKSTQRVSPTEAPVRTIQPSTEPPVDLAALEEERERFLRNFKSHVLSAPLEINATSSYQCTLKENHESSDEPAAVCQCCFNRLQERADLMEGALHMDLREATQIIYDAVWSDSSDPGKTYQNAAQALLTEMRNRAGIALVMGPLQTLPH